MQVVSHIGALQKLPQIAESALTVGTEEKEFYDEISRNRHYRRQVLHTMIGELSVKAVIL